MKINRFELLKQFYILIKKKACNARSPQFILFWSNYPQGLETFKVMSNFPFYSLTDTVAIFVEIAFFKTCNIIRHWLRLYDLQSV